MENTLRKDVAEAIEFVLAIGQLGLIMSKKETGDVGEFEIKAQHKKNCELLEKMLEEKVKITNYEKFADMVQRCDMALIIGCMAQDQNMPKRMISDLLDKYADDCVMVA